MQRVQTKAVHLQRTDGFLEGFLEGPPDRHGLPDRFHLCGQGRVSAGKLLEGKPGNLHDDVVDGRLEGRFRHARDVVGDLIERVPHRQLRRNLGDGETGRLGGQGRTPGHARVHLDDHLIPRLRIDRELDIGPAGVHADFPDDAHRRVPHDLVLFVGQRHGRGDGNAVPRVHAHRIDVLDRTHDHHVVLQIPHDFELELFPSDHGALDQNFADGAHGEAPVDDPLELLPVIGDIAPRPAEGEGWPDNGRKSDLLGNLHGLSAGPSGAAVGSRESDALHGLLEGLAIFRLVNGFRGRADQAHPVFGQGPSISQFHGDIQRRLSPHGRKQRIGTFPLDHLLHHVHRNGLDIGAIRQLRIGHDRGRIAVDQHDPVPLLPQGFAGLGPRIVELARLSDHDRTRPDQQDAVDVFTLGHADARW